MDGDYIKWDPKFEIGIPVIDEQHKKLVELCNASYQALIQGSAENSSWERSLSGALRECVEYVQTHFKNEETLMKACGYSGFPEHKRMHDSFIKKILEASGTFGAANAATAFKFVKFLYDWILSHIAHEDKLYVQSVLEFYRQRKNSGQ
ncbi:MAG: bacteriohemerythrin [Treponemataceae bacterium]|nr:bacteriohemerythrin [Treponemataceae bacterium]